MLGNCKEFWINSPVIPKPVGVWGYFGGTFFLLNQLGVDQPAVWSPDIYPLQLQGGLGGPVITGVISLRGKTHLVPKSIWPNGIIF